MAKTYTVCDGTGSQKTVTVEMTVGNETPYNYYIDEYGCSVSEKTVPLTFTITSGGASSDDFRIYYKMRNVKWEDGVQKYDSGSPLAEGNDSSIVMPAGQTSVTKDVTSYKRSEC